MILYPKADTPNSLEFELIAPDKSLSHRGIIFSFLTQGTSELEGFLDSQDTRATLMIAQKLGADIQIKKQKLYITPPKKICPNQKLNCLNSGTTMRLFSGLLSAQDGEFFFDGDTSLRKRPMQRIKTPLELMGASLSSSYAPFILRGNSLNGIHYHSPIASAQVKSAFILASLQAMGKSTYSEDEPSRDHTERFLSNLGADLKFQNCKIHIAPLQNLLPSYKLKIPNDPSSIMFLIVACLISKNTEIKINQVLLNPTRIHALEILKKMGANINYEVLEENLEKIGCVYVKSSPLKGIEVSSSIASFIDEIPALSIAFACAEGKSQIKNAQELRFKESDRISSIVWNLRQLGIEAQEFKDGFEVLGGDFTEGAIQSFGDHRIAMSFALAGIRTKVEIQDTQCIEISFPNFFNVLKSFVNFKE